VSATSRLRNVFDLAEERDLTLPCWGVDPEVMFPDREDHVALRAAKQVCATCPLRLECLDYALDRRIEFGVWGGLGERDREASRKRRQRAGGQPETLPLAV
jgi:WhiB family redox-sensing transcriptional regulator